MELLSTIALVLLTLVGYSSGCVLAAGDRRHVPGLLDLAVVVVLWVAAFALREEVGRWPGLAAAIVLAGIVAALRVVLRPRPPMSEAHGRSAAPLPDDGTIGARWRRFAQEMGNVQGRLIMGFFYFIVVTPFALISKLTRDGAASGGTTYWRERPAASPALAQARHQF